jgi:hypothetical protein
MVSVFPLSYLVFVLSAGICATVESVTTTALSATFILSATAVESVDTVEFEDPPQDIKNIVATITKTDFFIFMCFDY